MSKYLFTGSYSTEGIKGIVAHGGTKRLEAVRDLAESVGGSVESMYFALGDDDFYITIDLPDNVSSAAVCMTVNASGAVNARSIALLTPAEVDEASRKSPMYSPPAG